LTNGLGFGLNAIVKHPCTGKIMKKEIKVVVFEDESCAYDLPSNPEEFLKWWADKFALVPAEYRATTNIDCSTSTYYDSAQFEVEISYTRLETAAEEAARLEKEDDRQKFIENQELCQLEKLKAKYGV
jgi:hypothetical protein